MEAQPTSEPKGKGQLLETPFCHLVLYLYRHGQDGTLIVSSGGADTLIRFQRGRPIAARLSAPAERLLDGLLPLCGLREGQFAFYADDLLGQADDLAVGATDPYELLGASLEDHVRDDMVEALLQRFGGQRLRLVQGRDLGRMRLKPAYMPFIDLIRAAPATPEELLAQTELPKPIARRLLYALIAAHMVGSDDRREQETFRSQVEPRSTPPATTPVAMPVDRVAWQRLVSMRPNASLRPGSNIPPVSLIPPTAAIPQVSQRPPAPSSFAPAAEEPANRLKRVEQLLLRGRTDDAISETKAMLVDGPDRVDLLALLAHALFEKHSVQQDDGLPRHVLEAIKRAADADPDYPRTIYVKGLVAKRAGDTRKALAYFKRVLQSDPKHVEAQRELRLAKLRDGQ